MQQIEEMYSATVGRTKFGNYLHGSSRAQRFQTLIWCVLKRHVWFCLIVSLIAFVHGKVCWLMQPITEQWYYYIFNYDLHNSLLMHRHDFTWVTKVENRRPISLINVDTKIISKILAGCLKSVISSWSASDQAAYVPGRYKGESIRLTSDLLEYMDVQNLPGHFVTVDTEKAFDSVDHTFLFVTLKKFGFGDIFIKWIKIILNRQECCIMNNGHSTGDFPVLSETRQREPISTYRFILVMEVLFIQTRNNKNIRGLKIFGYGFKLTSFANDVSYFLSDIASIEELLRVLEQSKQFTALKNNYDKSEISDIVSKKGAEEAFSDLCSVALKVIL